MKSDGGTQNQYLYICTSLKCIDQDIILNVMTLQCFEWVLGVSSVYFVHYENFHSERRICCTKHCVLSYLTVYINYPHCMKKDIKSFVAMFRWWTDIVQLLICRSRLRLSTCIYCNWSVEQTQSLYHVLKIAPGNMYNL